MSLAATTKASPPLSVTATAPKRPGGLTRAADGRTGSQIRTLPSSHAVASITRPSTDPNATLPTLSGCGRDTSMGCPELANHTAAERSTLPVASIVDPATCVSATARTSPLCAHGGETASPVDASQTRATPLESAVASTRCSPTAPNAMALISDPIKIRGPEGAPDPTYRCPTSPSAYAIATRSSVVSAGVSASPFIGLAPGMEPRCRRYRPDGCALSRSLRLRRSPYDQRVRRTPTREATARRYRSGAAAHASWRPTGG